MIGAVADARGLNGVDHTGGRESSESMAPAADGLAGLLFSSLGQSPRPIFTVSSISNFFFLSSVQICISGLTQFRFWLGWISAAVTAPSFLTKQNGLLVAQWALNLNLLQVHADIGHVLDNTVDRREFVHRAVHLHPR